MPGVFRPLGAEFRSGLQSHGLRRGLYSSAASRLVRGGCNCSERAYEAKPFREQWPSGGLFGFHRMKQAETYRHLMRLSFIASLAS